MIEKLEKLFDKLVAKATFRRRPVDETGPRYADLNDRAIAAAIDVFLLYFLLFPLFLWIQMQVFSLADHEKLSQLQGSAFSLSQQLSILWEAYQLQLWVLNCCIQIMIIGMFIVGAQIVYGTTLGKYLLGLRIVDMKTLEKPARWQYVVRYLGYIPSTLLLMIGIFWISFNKERRGWHDYLARTTVINIRPHGWYWQQVKRLWRWCVGLLRRELKN